MPYGMELPKGKVCCNCVSYNRCKALFSCRHNNNVCDFSPSRFCERPADKGSAEPQTDNSDYTAALEAELDLLWSNGTVEIIESTIHEVASRLNSAVKEQQNCA
jgi:hypothetical protein